jgi:predicted MFS family arabinose efflux permease
VTVGRGRPSPRRVVGAGSLALTAAVVPVFLTGALSGRMGDDLHFGDGAAGAAVAAFFVGSGALAVPMAKVTERIGPARALRAGVGASAACALAVAGIVHSWWQLCVVLLLGGAAVGLVDTGVARAFDDAVPDVRQGLAFGVKEASVPAASLAAGLSIPVLVDRTGWRAAFVLGAVLAPVVWGTVPRITSTSGGRAGDGVGERLPAALVLFAAGVGAACAAATAAGTLLVPAFEDRGWSESGAGWLLAGASLASIGVRVVAGVRSDGRPQGSWRQLTILVAVGASGAVLLAATAGPVMGAVGAVAVIGAGWGWTGLAYVTAVRVGGRRPAAAAGVVLTGLSIGGAGGPAAFGAIASTWSYSAAWGVTAVALVAGGVAVAGSRRSLEPARSPAVG